VEALGVGVIPEVATLQEAIQAMEDIAATIVIMAMLEILVAEGTIVAGTQGEGKGVTIRKHAAKSSN
jgi:hypothetical protein